MGTTAEDREALDAELSAKFDELIPSDEPAKKAATEPATEPAKPATDKAAEPAKEPAKEPTDSRSTLPKVGDETNLKPADKPSKDDVSKAAQTLAAAKDKKPAEPVAPVVDDSLLLPPGPDGQPRKVDTKVAPVSWRKEAAAKFAEIPAEIRQEIHKREDDMHRGLAEYKSRAQYAEAVHQEFEPYIPFMRANNLNEIGVIKDLMSVAWTLKNGSAEQKARLILEVGANNGIDWNLAASLAQGMPTVDPQIAALQRENEEIKRSQYERDQAENMRIQQKANADAQAFFSDPKHEFAHIIREEMARFIESGQANTLEEAYDKAAWANPVVRAKLQARQVEDEARKAAEKAAAAEQASSVNVSRGATPAGGPPKSTLNEELSSAYDRLIAGA